AEPGNVSGETFTVTIGDTNGLFSAVGNAVTGSGSNSLSITGSLSDVNVALATLTEANVSTAPDTITLQVADNLGNVASTSTEATVVPLAPQFTSPSALSVIQGTATPLGVDLSEPGVFAGESLTATITDTNGILSASGDSVVGSGGHNLLISGSWQQIN